MQLTILGGCGGWPAPGGACSGYLLEHDGFVLLIDPGYAVVPRLLQLMPASAVDAVLVSHGHPDHCADVNPLLRVRRFTDPQPPALPLYSLPESLDAVLALDRQSMLGEAYDLRTFDAGEGLRIGPFNITTRLLPHPRPNSGFRIAADATLVYTGDAGPSADTVELAHGADLLLAEASYADEVPADLKESLCSADDAGRQAVEAGVKALVLTHLIPGQDERLAARAARTRFLGPVHVARAGLRLPIETRDVPSAG